MAKRNTERNLIAALDIGTSKVVVLIGEITPDKQIEVIGIGKAPSKGLKKGIVVNIEATVHSIEQAVKEAELMADCDLQAAFTGIAGSHIRSLNSHGIVAIRKNEVMLGDIERVIDAAKAVAIPADQKLLHILLQEFIIDNQTGIKEPTGMSGVRLEAKVHLITGAISAAQNIVKCVKRCGLEVNDIILEQLASSYAVLSDDEKELGVCLIDIGGGTTDVAVFIDGAIRHTVVLPIAGDQVTNDIAIALCTPTQSAEKLKLEQGNALATQAAAKTPIEVPRPSERQGQQATIGTLAEVIQARYEELFTLVADELRRRGLHNAIGAGAVLTGGGAQVPGLATLAEQTLDMSVRVGHPANISVGHSVNVKGLTEQLNSPVYSTAVGLLLYGLLQQDDLQMQLHQHKALFTRMKHWLQRHRQVS